MAAPREIVWDLEPHTRAKHEILTQYLQAWIPILTQGKFPEIMYVDGCAGPGRYSKGEDGSPIIALRIALQQPAHVRTTIRFVFIEELGDRADLLSEIIASLSVPDNCQIELYGSESFETAFERVLSAYNSQGQPLPPTFAFIDPFGYSDVPLSIVREILKHSSCEVLVNFMYEGDQPFSQPPQSGKALQTRSSALMNGGKGVDLQNLETASAFFTICITGNCETVRAPSMCARSR